MSREKKRKSQIINFSIGRYCGLAQKIKNTRLLPSLREKKRYVIFEIISDKSLEIQAIVQAIQKMLIKLVGEIGAAVSGIYVPQNLYNTRIQRGIIRVNNTMTDSLRASLSMIRFINNEQVIVRSLSVSGTLEKAKLKTSYKNEEMTYGFKGG